MKIAICLSGQPRFLKKCIPSLKKHLLEKNEADLFIHTWWDSSLVNEHFDSSIPYQHGRVGVFERDVPELIYELNPTLFIIEKPFNFNSEGLISAPTANVSSLLSNFYSQQKSIELKRQFENDHDFIYDAVLRTRIDMYYYDSIDIKSVFRKNCFLLNAEWQTERQYMIQGLGDYTMDDNFVIAESKLIDIYGETYSNFRSLNRLVNPPFAENYLGWNCRITNNLNTEIFPFPINIAQRIAL